MNEFLSGAILMGWAVAGLFFLWFWKSSKDRFFALFAGAFWLFALERLLIGLIDPANEFRPYVYLVRLTAFLVILAAIIDKNRGEQR